MSEAAVRAAVRSVVEAAARSVVEVEMMNPQAPLWCYSDVNNHHVHVLDMSHDLFLILLLL